MFGKWFSFGKKKKAGTRYGFAPAEQVVLDAETFTRLQRRSIVVEEQRLQDASVTGDGVESPLYLEFLRNTDCSVARYLCLEDNGEALSLEGWKTVSPGPVLTSAMRLVALVDKGLAEWNEAKRALLIPDFVLAALPTQLFDVIGLPPVGNINGRVISSGIAFTDSLEVRMQFSRNGNTLHFPKLDGMTLTVGGSPASLFGDLFYIADTVRVFMEKDYANQEERNFQWSKTCAIFSLTPLTRDLQKEDMLSSRFLPASRLSLELDAEGNIRPVFLRAGYENGEASFTPILSERQSASVEKYLLGNRSINGHLYLGYRAYLFMTPEVKKVVGVVRDVVKGSPQKKAAFFSNPTREIVKALENEAGYEDIADMIDGIFIETPEFLSQRVEAFGPWEPKTCSFLQPQKTDWFSDTDDRYGVMLGGQCVWVKEEDIKSLITRIKTAQGKQQETIEVEGETINVGMVDVSALEELSKGMHSARTDGGRDTPRSSESSTGEKPEKEKKVRMGPLLKTNLEELEFKAEKNKRETWLHPLQGLNPDYALFEHQEQSLAWLETLWTDGYSGALLADDMGLGKTLQCLAFMKWVADGWTEDPKPALIVAPVTLMKNWFNEAEKYFGDEIGDPMILSSAEAKKLKKRARSDVVYQFAERRVVITSYETVRDKIEIFLNVDWGLMVLDEVQKIKNPTSLLTETVKAVKADFVLAMTGTPVENSFMDLWSIMDAVLPGYLKTAKEFAGNFCGSRPVEEAGLELNEILQGRGEGLPFMLRRLKEDRLKDLPAKEEIVVREPMPAAQVTLYREILNGLKENSAEDKRSGSNTKLVALQRLAACSLSPDWDRLRAGEALTEEIVGNSAKFKALFKCLDKIREDGEKAIVFVQHLDLQEILAEAIRKRYSLDHLPGMINGSMEALARQRVVDDFQNGDPLAFDVVVLMGRSAGTGLTMTAANNIIHLERWWNPAVEDQCSARAYRIGQTKDVKIYIPLAVFPSEEIVSFDEKLEEFLTVKRLRSSSVLIPSSESEMTVGLFKTVFRDSI